MFFFKRLVPSTSQSASSDVEGNNFIMVTLMIIMAVVLYVMRPNSLRRTLENNIDINEKVTPSSHNGGGVRQLKLIHNVFQ